MKSRITVTSDRFSKARRHAGTQVGWHAPTCLDSHQVEPAVPTRLRERRLAVHRYELVLVVYNVQIFRLEIDFLWDARWFLELKEKVNRLGGGKHTPGAMHQDALAFAVAPEGSLDQVQPMPDNAWSFKHSHVARAHRQHPDQRLSFCPNPKRRQRAQRHSVVREGRVVCFSQLPANANNGPKRLMLRDDYKNTAHVAACNVQ